MTYFVIVLGLIWFILFLIVNYVVKGIKTNNKVSKEIKAFEKLHLENKIEESFYKKQRIELVNKMESSNIILLGIIILIIYLIPVVYVTGYFIIYLLKN